MNINPITESLFECLNSDGITYCVLRNYEFLPHSTGESDLDIWIKGCEYSRFLKALSRVCEKTGARLVSYKEDSRCPQFAMCTYLFGLQIDTHVGIANVRGAAYMDESLIESHILQFNGVSILAPEMDALMCFLKETLNNRYCRVPLYEKARKALSEKSHVEMDEYLRAFSPKMRFRIAELIQKGSYDKHSIAAIGREAAADLQTFSIRLNYCLRQIGKFRRFLRPLGYSIAFLGTDGSGKSTIIEAITPILSQAFHKGVRYEHMRPNWLPSLAVALGKRKSDAPQSVCSDPHGGHPSGFLGSLLRISYYWIDYTFGYLFKVFPDKSVKNHVWLFDRYYYDCLFDPQRSCIKLPRWVLKLYVFFVPKPDLIVCLGTKAETIIARKQELPLEEVRRQVEDLRHFAFGNPRAIWVDTGCNLQESTRKVMNAILDMMSHRFQNVLK